MVEQGTKLGKKSRMDIFDYLSVLKLFSNAQKQNHYSH